MSEKKNWTLDEFVVYCDLKRAGFSVERAEQIINENRGRESLQLFSNIWENVF
ncbi:MAG: hypothetical protein ACFFCZ_05975 [Promethearchaeota archaeon]